MTKQILHVSGDFPDPIEPFKTPVIKGLLDLTGSSFEHRVISINRATPSLSELLRPFSDRSLQRSIIRKSQPFDSGIALQYSAPPRGILHRSKLERLGEQIASQIESLETIPDLLVGHKLTIEGVAVAKAAELTGIPYAITIQANTDRRILSARPDLRGLFRSIYRNAQMVCTFTPIARALVESVLGTCEEGIRLIPCPTELDQITEPRVTGGDLISVFHLKNRKVKNLSGLVRAAQIVAPEYRNRAITVLGGGNDMDMAACAAVAAKAVQLKFAGPVERQAMQTRMNEACALVVPSRSESFGLVFVEALFAGLPIIYPKGTAIDGYFDGQEFALGVDAHSPRDIAQAMARAIREESEMKASLYEWQKSGGADKFSRTSIAKSYKAALNSALAR